MREKTRNRGYQPSSSASSQTDFGSRQSSLSGSGRGKRKTRRRGGSVLQKKLVTRCFYCNLLDTWSEDPIQANVTSCTLQETVHVYPEPFVTISISIEQELRRAGACDTCCNRTVAGQEWMNDYVFSPKKLKSKYSTLLCQQRFKFGAGDNIVCKTPYFIPVLTH